MINYEHTNIYNYNLFKNITGRGSPNGEGSGKAHGEEKEEGMKKG